MRFSLIFLTWNEIDGLTALIDKIPMKEFDEVFAVDGGSTDGTLELYAKKGVRVIQQVSKGRGEAFRIAMKESTGDVLVFFSPDGNENPADLPKFKPYFLNNQADMVIASRMMKGARNEEDDELFRWRKWANNAFNLMANVAFRRAGSYVTDSINGYRAVTRAAFEKIQPDGSGYTIEYQMTIRAFKHRLRIAEFPTQEGARIGGESYAKSIPTGIQFLKLFFREFFRG